MPYTKEKPKLPRSADELRATIPGWGVDLDPAVRPAARKELYDPSATGAHWDFPERQVPRYPREKSVEHRELTPVFGTVCPPRGLSGLIRRYAYRFSEGQTTHWTLLLFADRVDVVESRITALLRGRPDFLPAEAGLRSELKHNGLRARLGQRRADLKHLPFDLLAFAGTALTVYGAQRGVRALVRAFRPKRRWYAWR
jgi:hypothetical protein